MTFEEKVRSMSIKEILMAMIESYKNPFHEVNIWTYGQVTKRTRFKGLKLFGFQIIPRIYKEVLQGCAATNTVCYIAGKPFTNRTIVNSETRAEALGCSKHFLEQFEMAINSLRQGDFQHYNIDVSEIYLPQVPVKYSDIRLAPLMGNTKDDEQLIAQYTNFANKLN